jgi:hypothetical protein
MALVYVTMMYDFSYRFVYSRVTTPTFSVTTKVEKVTKTSWATSTKSQLITTNNNLVEMSPIHDWLLVASGTSIQILARNYFEEVNLPG